MSTKKIYLFNKKKLSIKERCTQENWSVFCGPPRCQHLRKKHLEKPYLRKKY